MGVFGSDFYFCFVFYREVVSFLVVWLVFLFYFWYGDKGRGEYLIMGLFKDRDGEWLKVEFGLGIKGNIDNVFFLWLNFCMNKVFNVLKKNCK